MIKTGIAIFSEISAKSFEIWTRNFKNLNEFHSKENKITGI